VNCSASKANLAAYFDGDLSPKAAMLVAGHLAACPACSAYAKRLQSVEVALTQLHLVEPPMQFTAEVMAKVSALPKVRPATPLWWAIVSSSSRSAMLPTG